MSKNISIPFATTDSDAKLVEAVQCGHPDAFNILTNRHRDRIFQVLLRGLGNAENAEDVTQESFLYAFCKINNLRDASQFSAWIYNIATHRRNSFFRKQINRTKIIHFERCEKPMQSLKDENVRQPEDHLLMEESAEKIHRALSRLTLEHQEILVLRLFRDLDYESISHAIKCNRGTVRSRLHRARHHFHDALIEEKYEGPMDFI